MSQGALEGMGAGASAGRFQCVIFPPLYLYGCTLGTPARPVPGPAVDASAPTAGSKASQPSAHTSQPSLTHTSTRPLNPSTPYP